MSQTRPARRQRKPAEAVHGTVKLLHAVGAVGQSEGQTGEIELNGKGYYLTVRATGYTLTSFDARRQESTVYDVPADLSSCDCPDGTYRPERPGGCKHVAGLRALISRGKIPAVPVCTAAHSDAEADALAAQWDADATDAEAEAWHAQFDAA